MLFEINESEVKRAKTPHELSMLNLVAFHLLAAPASIVLDIGLLGFLVPLTLSLCFIAFVWYQAMSGKKSESWFIRLHWRQAANRNGQDPGDG